MRYIRQAKQLCMTILCLTFPHIPLTLSKDKMGQKKSTIAKASLFLKKTHCMIADTNVPLSKLLRPPQTSPIQFVVVLSSKPCTDVAYAVSLSSSGQFFIIQMEDFGVLTRQASTEYTVPNPDPLRASQPKVEETKTYYFSTNPDLSESYRIDKSKQFMKPTTGRFGNLLKLLTERTWLKQSM